MAVIEFGRAPVTLRVEHQGWAGRFQGPEAPMPLDLDERITEAMAEPLQAPPLLRAFVPGDRVSLVLDSGLPYSERVLVPILRGLADAGVDLAGSAIVCTPGTGSQWIDRLIEEIPDELADVQVVRHDPEGENSLSYLASTQKGQRIYLNRHVLDADAFLVVGRAGFDPVLGFRGTVSDLFPCLSDGPALRRSRSRAMEAVDDGIALREQQDLEEVGWLSGLFYAVAVSHDRHGEADAVWLGEARAVLAASEEYIADRWTIEPPEEASDLAVITLSSTQRPADWETLGAGLAVAERLVSRGGRILVLSDLEEPPGPTGRWLAEDENRWNLLARLRSSEEADAVSTSQCARALSHAHVYLLSRLAPDVVESLGMVPVGSPDEAARLIGKARAPYLIENADRVVVEGPA